jgi:hypothetical protein
MNTNRAIEFTATSSAYVDGQWESYRTGESIEVLDIRPTSSERSTIEGRNGTIFTIPNNHFIVVEAICRTRVNHPLEACGANCVYFDVEES